MRSRLPRRALLALLGGGVSATLVGCGTPADGDKGDTPPVTTQRLVYGEDPSQWAELTLPAGAPRGVVVVIHGGFWKSSYDASLGEPLAADLASRGWAALNVEYRRIGRGKGSGGGFPATFDDVSAAIDLLDTVEDLDLSTVIALGHSAGGHLAVWAAGRTAHERWSSARVPLTAAISQAGVLDLKAAFDDNLGGGAVAALMGGAPGPDYDDADPTRMLPLQVPVRCVHAPDDANVPIGQSEEYVRRATAAGADATLTRVTGGHFDVIDVDSEAWAVQIGLLDEL